MAFTKVEFNENAQDKLFKGVETIYKGVSPTLGPRGRYGAIEQQFGSPRITKDGVSIARAIVLEEPTERMGASFITDIANKSNDTGDGTTTSTILAYGVIKEGRKAIASGVSSSELKKGIDCAKDMAIKMIKERSKEIESSEDIKVVATIASNNDEKIGSLVSDAFDRVGADGLITTDDSQTTETYVDFVEGMEFDRGWKNPYFVTNPEKMLTEFKDAKVLVTDERIADMQLMANLLQQTMSNGNPLLIVGGDLTDSVLEMLVVNNVRGAVKVCAVDSPEFGDTKKEMLIDIATLTGATFISSSMGRPINTVTFDDLGSAKKVTVSKETTTIVDGSGDESAIEERVALINAQIKEEKVEAKVDIMKKRIARLGGGVCVLKISGNSKEEIGELRDRIEDTLASVKASIKGGVVLGGGVTLLSVANKLVAPKELSEDSKVGFNLLKKAMELPIKQLAINSGVSSDVIIDDILKHDDGKYGYNFATLEFDENLCDKVVDPTLVETQALINTSSIVGHYLNTNVVITNIPEKKDVPNQMPRM